MIKEIRDLLEKKFEEKDHKKNITGFTYVEADKYIARLNEVFGSNWSFEVVNSNYDKDADTVVVHGRLEVPNVIGKNEDGSYLMSGTIRKDGFGSKEVGRFAAKHATKAGKVMDLGNDYKSSVSDAIKTSAKLLGIALYLYDKEYYKEKEREEKETPNEDEKKALEGPVNAQQKTAIINICKMKKLDFKEFLTSKKLELDKLTQAQAGELIKELNSKK